MKNYLIRTITLFIVIQITACGGGETSEIKKPPIVSTPGQVTTLQGKVQGEISGNLAIFRGVAYAEVPIGNLRFKAPQPPQTFGGIEETLEFSPVCTQPSQDSTVGEEDCLYLNIWAHNDDTIRPVMVYLHPGSANGIGGQLASINPTELANASDVIVVNLNRRIGLLGYLAIDELVQENPMNTAGNYGLHDVIAALEWVKANIAEFNGDPNRIMLFGTSAGARISCLLLASPEASGLINSLSIQSSPCGERSFQSLNDQTQYASRLPLTVDSHREILTTTGCDLATDKLVCLRELSASELILAGVQHEDDEERQIYVPIIDGITVLTSPLVALETQIIGQIPLIIGMASNEVAGLFENLNIPDDDTYLTVINYAFPPIADDLYLLYPSADYEDPKQAFVTMFADLVFNCSAERMALGAFNGGSPSYLYEISRGFDSGSLAANGGVHAIDIPYLFGTFDRFDYIPDTQALAIRDSMRLAWSSMANDPTGIPKLSSTDNSEWPLYEPVTASYAEFGDVIGGQVNHRGGRCEALRAVLNNLDQT